MKMNTKDPHTDRLVGLFLPTSRSAASKAGLRAAAKRKAEALAWTTPFPHLFLPVLVEEKVQEALDRDAKQRRLNQHTSRPWEVSTPVARLLSPTAGDRFTTRRHPDN